MNEKPKYRIITISTYATAPQAEALKTEIARDYGDSPLVNNVRIVEDEADTGSDGAEWAFGIGGGIGV